MEVQRLYEAGNTGIHYWLGYYFINVIILSIFCSISVSLFPRNCFIIVNSVFNNCNSPSTTIQFGHCCIEVPTTLTPESQRLLFKCEWWNEEECPWWWCWDDWLLWEDTALTTWLMLLAEEFESAVELALGEDEEDAWRTAEETLEQRALVTVGHLRRDVGLRATVGAGFSSMVNSLGASKLSVDGSTLKNTNHNY